MKTMLQISPWIALFLHTSLFAQSDKECDLIKQRISGTDNINAVCSALYQECSVMAAKTPDPKETQNQCLKNVGDCQMAGQLSGEDLQRVVNEYKSKCKS